MKSLRVEQVLKEKQTHDPNSIKELSLGHRALSDVSCLSEFRNLERLDLRLNNLTSLQGLKSCVNLKWLSVVENKLQTLNGIEGLSKLTVINAGKNKLKSMNEISSLVSLRALILNDNEISSICKLDQLKDLNTLGMFLHELSLLQISASDSWMISVWLFNHFDFSFGIDAVLSRNPISEIGDSLSKSKNISKISLSNCRIQSIGSSLKSCTELKELRLAHNEITVLPTELILNKRLQNLDVGNNMIMKWADLKALGSLSSLRNLNLRGNPIADNEKLTKKVTKLLPGLHVFNAKPLAKSSKHEKHGQVDSGDEELDVPPHKKSEEHPAEDIKSKKGSKHKKSEEQSQEDKQIKKISKQNKSEKDHKSRKSLKGNAVGENRDGKDHGAKEGTEQKQLKEKDKPSSEVDAVQKKNKRTRPEEVLDILDNAETSFAELFANGMPESPGNDREKKRIRQQTGLAGDIVTPRNKKTRTSENRNKDAMLDEFPQEIEIGMGGDSKWE